ncbi:MAG TPA: hypothetical protein VHP11_00505 [Tepidisphaeraceae bacterium]|nr:hypothetical protein [Tepidisphaeraceae bacterium]
MPKTNTPTQTAVGMVAHVAANAEKSADPLRPISTANKGNTPMAVPTCVAIKYIHAARRTSARRSSNPIRTNAERLINSQPTKNRMALVAHSTRSIDSTSRHSIAACTATGRSGISSCKYPQA